MTLQSLYTLGYCIHRPVWARQSTHNVRARSQANHSAQGGGAAPRAGSSPARIAETTPHHPRSHAAALQKMSPHHTLDVPRHRETRRYARARPTPAEVASSLRINDTPAPHPRRPSTLDVPRPPLRRRDIPTPPHPHPTYAHGGRSVRPPLPLPHCAPPNPARTTIMPQTPPHEITNALYARTHGYATARRAGYPHRHRAHARLRDPAARRRHRTQDRDPDVRHIVHRTPPAQRSSDSPPSLAQSPTLAQPPPTRPARGCPPTARATRARASNARLRARSHACDCANAHACARATVQARTRYPRAQHKKEARKASADTKDAQGDGTHLHARTIRQPAAVPATARAHRQARITYHHTRA
ncbi:hypothetical protein C8J57DRAFT_1713436 [Mycena rebaudengoi]|nr:hypothetical protein C8J57DRAFT_1713436 [Mycena rebaudengoi]